MTSTEPDDDLPRRPAVHVLGDVAEAAFVGLIPNDWIVRKIPSDYGLDLEVEVVTDERVTGATFTVQMKGTDQQLRNDSVQIRIKARSINYWRRRPERVMLAVYAQRENIVLWTWADRIPKPKEDEVSVTIGRANLLADISWPDFASQLQQYYRDRANAYDEKLRTFSARSAETPLAVRLIPIVIGTIEGDSTAETEMIRDFLIRIVLNAEEGKIALEESTKCYPEYSTKFSKRYSIGFKAFARFRRAMTDFFDQVDRIRNLFDGGDSL